MKLKYLKQLNLAGDFGDIVDLCPDLEDVWVFSIENEKLKEILTAEIS